MTVEDPCAMPGRVSVVGGGPAGLMAAEQLAGRGMDVTVFEHKRSVGRKFLLAGRGGLNITHSESLDALMGRYGPAEQFLAPALQAFSPDDLRAWCAGLGEETFAGSSGRVFPESFRATPLLRSWLARLDSLGVQFQTGARWTGRNEDGANEFTSSTGDFIDEPAATVFALGGASWPRVGSDGSWVTPFKAAGIQVRELAAANCGVMIDWSPILIEKYAGVPLKNVVLSAGEQTTRGDVVITSTGLEGGPVYGLGPALRPTIDEGAGDLIIDAHPDLSMESLTERLAHRRPKASVTSWMNSAGIAPVIVVLARDLTSNQLPDEPKALAQLLKGLPVPVKQLADIDRAISTAGGVVLAEIDANYMLRSMPGVFVAGEMLDWEAPTGGYLLQACLSTGFAAAAGVATWCQEQASN